jgi:hypothetical protein
MTTETNRTSIISHIKDVASVFSGGHGVIVVLSALAAVIYIPYRVSTIEEHDRQQDSKIALIEADAQQRRELLASVAATVMQIDLRTRRIEDALIHK